jgi:hypothetical protein
MRQLDFNNSRAFDNRDHGIGFTANNGAIVFNVGDAVLDAVFGLAPDGKNAREVFDRNVDAIHEAARQAHAKGRTGLKREDFQGGGGVAID